MQNVQQTIISQYADSPIMQSMIAGYNSALDPSANFEEFYNNIWNIKTAVGFGLDLWGRIVGVSRIIQVPIGSFFGFSEGDYNPFGISPFYSDISSTQSYPLSDSAFRLLIYAKALSNISDSSTPSYNKVLMTLFPGRGNCYVSDTGGMNSRLTFEFYLFPFEISILKQSNAFQSPCGVQFEIMDFIPSQTFTFLECGVLAGPFGAGVLFRDFE